MRKLRIFFLYSGAAGGVGKTTFSFHLAYHQAMKGKNVLLVDFDSQAGSTKCCIGDTYGKAFERYPNRKSTLNVVECSYDKPSDVIYPIAVCSRGRATTTEPWRTNVLHPVDFLSDKAAWYNILRTKIWHQVSGGRPRSKSVTGTLSLTPTRVSELTETSLNPANVSETSVWNFVQDLASEDVFDTIIFDLPPNFTILHKLVFACCQRMRRGAEPGFILVPINPNIKGAEALHNVRDEVAKLQRWKNNVEVLGVVTTAVDGGAPLHQTWLDTEVSPNAKFLGYTLFTPYVSRSSHMERTLGEHAPIFYLPDTVVSLKREMFEVLDQVVAEADRRHP